MNKIELEFKFTYGVQISSKSVNKIKNHPLKRGRTLMCMVGRVLKRIARENVNVSLTLPASLPSNSEFARRCSTQSVEKSDSVTGALCLFHFEVAITS